MLTYTYPHNPRGRLKLPYAITKLTTHFMCCQMSDLVIYKFTETRCQYTTQTQTLTHVQGEDGQLYGLYHDEMCLLCIGIVPLDHLLWSCHSCLGKLVVPVPKRNIRTSTLLSKVVPNAWPSSCMFPKLV